MTGQGFSAAGWAVVGERDGVALRTRGEGTPVFVLPGLEGSGESCLHLVVPVLEREHAGPPVRPVLVDYAEERHRELDGLVATIASLVSEHARTAATCDLWCQSFGNLLGVKVLERTGLRVRRAVLVSAFHTLARWKTSLVPPILAVTPDPLYHATLGPVSRWQFGPDGGNNHHEFFAAIGRTAKEDLVRRLRWLEGPGFAEAFRGLRPERGGVWLGADDRLVQLEDELVFFGTLAAAGRLDLAVLAGSGHVVLPPTVIAAARESIGAWFWRSDEAT